jgi:hypothetical protein
MPYQQAQEKARQSVDRNLALTGSIIGGKGEVLMAHIDGPVLSTFQNLVNGTHDFDEEEIDRLHEMAHEVTAIVQASEKRALAHAVNSSADGMAAVSQPASMPGGFSSTVGHWDPSGEGQL